MRMIKKNIHIAFVIVFCSIFALSCQSKKKKIYWKLQGFANFEQWNSTWTEEYWDIILNGGAAFFSDTAIELPNFSYASEHENRITADMVKENPILESAWEKQIKEGTIVQMQRRKESCGRWEVISTSPDSILIDVPKHPLNGRYAITFFIDPDGCPEMGLPQMKYKFILKNEKMFLVFCKNREAIRGPINGWATKK